MARILPMPMNLAETLDKVESWRISQLTREIPAVIVDEKDPEFKKQAARETITEIADNEDGLVLEYHHGWRNHDVKYFFAVKSIEAFEAMIAIFEIMEH